MADQARNHVVFLHEKTTKRKCDRYILNLAQAYHHLGHKVTLYTAHFNRQDTADDFKVIV